ncbi:MAG: hypothetical protein J6Q69_02125 [Clostridia bacterium]|nr:hypothetical protein [Clostridia bacterium]
MRNTKKVTLSAMASALSSVILLLSSFLGVMEISVGAIASLLVVLINIEVKGPYPYLVWAVTSTISILLFPSKTIGVAYLLVFGIYPILKAYFERLPRVFWWLVKLAYFTVVLAVMILATELVLGVSFFEEMPNTAPILKTLMKVGIIGLFYVAFVAYDMFITVLIRLYFMKFRDKFKRLFR